MHPGHFTMTTGGLRKKLEEGSTEQVTLEEATAEATHILADVATPAFKAILRKDPLFTAQRISQIAVDLREAAPQDIPIQVWVLQTGDGCQPGLPDQTDAVSDQFHPPLPSPAQPSALLPQIVLDKQRCVLKLKEQQRSGNKPRALSLPERYPEGSFTLEHDCMQEVFRCGCVGCWPCCARQCSQGGGWV